MSLPLTPTCTKSHPLEVLGTSRDNGWTCSGMTLFPGGCKMGCTGLNQTKGWERWRCSLCDFDLCETCLKENVNSSGEGAAVAAAAAAAANIPQAPRCKSNHRMVLISIDGPFPYKSAYVCDLCRGRSSQGHLKMVVEKDGFVNRVQVIIVLIVTLKMKKMHPRQSHRRLQKICNSTSSRKFPISVSNPLPRSINAMPLDAITSLAQELLLSWMKTNTLKIPPRTRNKCGVSKRRFSSTNTRTSVKSSLA